MFVITIVRHHHCSSSSLLVIIIARHHLTPHHPLFLIIPCFNVSMYNDIENLCLPFTTFDIYWAVNKIYFYEKKRIYSLRNGGDVEAVFQSQRFSMTCRSGVIIYYRLYTMLSSALRMKQHDFDICKHCGKTPAIATDDNCFERAEEKGVLTLT